MLEYLRSQMPRVRANAAQDWWWQAFWRLCTRSCAPPGWCREAERTCRSHHKYGVRKEHYPQLLVILTSTVESTLEKEWTEEQQTAWSNVLSFLVSVVEDAYLEGARAYFRSLRDYAQVWRLTKPHCMR